MQSKSYLDEKSSKIKKKHKQNKRQKQQRYVELQPMGQIKSQPNRLRDQFSKKLHFNESHIGQKDEGYKKIKQLLRSHQDPNPTSNTILGSTEYKPFQIPPDFEQARLHGLAKKIGKIRKCCICCQMPFKKIPFKLGERIEKFASLGTAFTLFFYYNKQMIFLLFIVFFVGGLQQSIFIVSFIDFKKQLYAFKCYRKRYLLISLPFQI